MATLASSLAHLYQVNDDVRAVTDRLHEIMGEVDRRFTEVENLPGRLVRIEGAEALVVVQDGARRRLESHSASYLQALGIVETDTPFILQEQRHRPGHRVEIFFPAIDAGQIEPGPREALAEVYAPPQVSDHVLEAFGLLDEPEAPAVRASASLIAESD
jgi:hypothetical protein